MFVMAEVKSNGQVVSAVVKSLEHNLYTSFEVAGLSPRPFDSNSSIVGPNFITLCESLYPCKLMINVMQEKNIVIGKKCRRNYVLD